MAASTTTVISSIEAKLPVCKPNLMPFHIDYNGPAPVSAFMRVEKLKSDHSDLEMGAKDKISRDVYSGVKALDESAVDEDMKVLEASSRDNSDLTNDMVTNAKASGSQAISESTVVVESQTSLSSDTTRVSLTPPVLEDEDKRFVSTFRGRTIHGLTIDLPSGYSGLVLRGEGDSNKKRESQEDAKDSKTKVKTQSTSQKASTSSKKKTTVIEKLATKSRGRLTRSAVSKPAVVTIDDEDEEMADAAPGPSSDNLNEQMDGLDDNDGASGDSSIRKLVPQAQFSSFTLWHADRPVDKASDEYHRTLTEWIALSQEIHRTDL